MLKDILIVLAALFIMLLFILVFAIVYAILIIHLENQDEFLD